MATLHKLQGAQNFELEGGEETGEIPDGSKNSRTISVEDLKIDVTGQPSSLLLFFFFFSCFLSFSLLGGGDSGALN